jgi:GNAT superfamily N-acetyltransferase
MMVAISQFGEGDIPFGKYLTDGENWHRTTKDWARLLRVEPSGIFKAKIDGKDAGVAAVVSYGTLAWIHSVIVAREYRGQGVGMTLMDACIGYCKGLGARCIKLDSVPAAKSFYEKLGFTEKFESLRFMRAGERGSALVQRMRPEDLRSVIPFDRAMTRIDRAKVIEEIYKDNLEWAFYARDSHGIRGYLLGWQGEDRVNLGPCVCVSGSDEGLQNLRVREEQQSLDRLEEHELREGPVFDSDVHGEQVLGGRGVLCDDISGEGLSPPYIWDRRAGLSNTFI